MITLNRRAFLSSTAPRCSHNTVPFLLSQSDPAKPLTLPRWQPAIVHSPHLYRSRKLRVAYPPRRDHPNDRCWLDDHSLRSLSRQVHDRPTSQREPSTRTMDRALRAGVSFHKQAAMRLITSFSHTSMKIIWELFGPEDTTSLRARSLGTISLAA